MSTLHGVQRVCREAVLHGPLVFLRVLPAEACLPFILGCLFQDVRTADILGSQVVLLWNKELAALYEIFGFPELSVTLF